MKKTDSMSIQQKSHMANQRIRNLRKAGVDYYAISDAEHYLQTMGRNYFYEGKNYGSKEEQKRVEQVLDKFLNSKSSTLRGINSINRSRAKALQRHGIYIDSDSIHEFYDFLKSEQFKSLTKYGDSGTIMDTFNQALEEGYTPAHIKHEFHKFLTMDNYYINDVQDALNQRGVIKWKD